MWTWRDRRARKERDLLDEIEFHIAEETRLGVEAGATPDYARASAVRQFGNVTLVREFVRDGWGGQARDALARDLRLGLRVLARQRLFAAFSILSLALGIGGAGAMFAVYDAIALRTLPVSEPGQLVSVSVQREGATASAFMPYAQFDALHRDATSLQGMFARRWLPTINVAFSGGAQIATGLGVTGDYHRTLGLRPAIGRLLRAADDVPGGPPVAVISHGYWRRRFGGQTNIVHATVLLNQVPFQIVGVEPEGFFGVVVGLAPDVTVPLHAAPLLVGAPRSGVPPLYAVEVMGRLRESMPLTQATEAVNAVYQHLTRSARATSDARHGRSDAGPRLRLVPGGRGGTSSLRSRYEEGLRVLLVLVAGVLGLASLNVAALFLARAEARRAEMSTRLALGASRGRLVRQLCVESAVIGACSGVLGLLIAWQSSRWFLRVATPNSLTPPVDLTPDWRLLTFMALVSLVTCVVFGLVPAARATRSLAIGSRGELGGSRRRVLDRGLVSAQTAAAVVLLVCAGLFGRSLHRLWTESPGYDRRDVLMFSLDASLIGQPPPTAVQTYRQVIEELRTLPAAEAVSLSIVRPVSDLYTLVDRVTQVGGRALPGEDAIPVAVDLIAPGYFDTMRIPLQAGRDFEAQDDTDAQKVAIVSERLARRLGPNPIGQRLTVGEADIREVVGVAADTRYASVKDAPRELVYLPYFQGAPPFAPTYQIRYVGRSSDVLRSATEAVHRVHPALVPFRAKTLEVQTQESFARERTLAWVTAYFGGFAWLLAAVGLYGLLSSTVGRRLREFGLRVALGATPRALGLTVLRETAAVLLAGVVVGSLMAIGAGRLVRTQLYGVEPADPLTLVAASAALAVLGALASFLPARRAARTDPMTALRHE